MYKCDIHGEKEYGWCDECKKILRCDCSRTTTSNGYIKGVEVILELCDTCEKPLRVWIK